MTIRVVGPLTGEDVQEGYPLSLQTAEDYARLALGFDDVQAVRVLVAPGEVELQVTTGDGPTRDAATALWLAEELDGWPGVPVGVELMAGPMLDPERRLQERADGDRAQPEADQDESDEQAYDEEAQPGTPTSVACGRTSAGGVLLTEFVRLRQLRVGQPRAVVVGLGPAALAQPRLLDQMDDQ